MIWEIGLITLIPLMAAWGIIGLVRGKWYAIFAIPVLGAGFYYGVFLWSLSSGPPLDRIDLIAKTWVRTQAIIEFLAFFGVISAGIYRILKGRE